MSERQATNPALINNTAAQIIYAPLVKKLDLVLSKIFLVSFPASSSPAAIKRLYLLPDLSPDKAPEQFLKFAYVILNTHGGKPFIDALLNIKSIAAWILNILPGRAAQIKQISALPAIAAGVIKGVPDNIIFSPSYGLFCKIHLPCGPQCYIVYFAGYGSSFKNLYMNIIRQNPDFVAEKLLATGQFLVNKGVSGFINGTMGIHLYK